MDCGLGLVRGTCFVFLEGGFSSVSASESECQQIRRFSIDSMCRNSQFTFLSLSPFFFFLFLFLTHTLSFPQHYLLIYPSIDLLPQRCVQSTLHHQPHRPDPKIHLDELGPKQKNPIRSRNHDSSSAAPEKNNKTTRTNFFSSLHKPPTCHLEK